MVNIVSKLRCFPVVRVFYLLLTPSLLTPSLLTPFLLTPLLLTPFLTSCSSDDDGYQSRLKELLMEDMSFTCEGGTQEQVYRHEDLSVYKVSNKESWCTSTLDVNNCKLVVSVKANNTYDARTDTVTLTDTISKSSRYLTVKQARNTGLFLDKTYAEASMYGDTISTKLKHNVSYEVQIPDTCNWVTQAQTSKTRGLDTTTITFYVKENKTYKDRDAVITVFNKDEKLTDKLTIHQPFKTEFKADSTNFEVNQYGDTITVNLTTNIPYDVIIPEDCSWITKKSSSGTRSQAALTRGTEKKTLTFFIKENKTYHGRDGVVTLSNKDAGVSIAIKIHQPFTAEFKPDKNYFEASQYGDTVSIKMTSNVSYDVTIPDDCDWITRIGSQKTRGVETSSILLKVAENKTYKAREAVVKVSNKDAGVSESITISQPFNTVFSVEKKDFEVPMEGSTFTVSLKHNIGYDVSIPSSCNWISKVTGARKAGIRSATRSAKGIDTTAIVFRAAENTTTKEREATITISNKDAGAEIKIYVHQPFTTTFTVDKTDAEVPMEGGTVTANVESNIPYEVKIPSDCNWVTLSSTSRTRGSKTSVLLFNVAANTSGRERCATITIGNNDLGITKALTIKQKFAAKFKVNTPALTVDDELGGTFSVSVSSNVDFTVSSQANWITVGSKEKVSGKNDEWTQQIIVSAMQSTDLSPSREGSVMFYAPDAEPSTVTVTQNRTFYFENSSITLTEAGQTLDLPLKNTKSRLITCTSNKPEVATVTSTGVSGVVKAVANGNAVITVKSADGKYSGTVNVIVDIPAPANVETVDDSEDDSDSDDSSGTRARRRIRK